MKNVNKATVMVLATLLSISGTNAQLLGVGAGANKGGGTTLLGGGKGGIATGAAMSEAGKYEVVTYDVTEINKLVLQYSKERQDEDLKFIEKVQVQLVDQLETLRDELNKPEIGLLNLTISSAGGNFIPLETFLGARKDFNQRLISADIAMKSIFNLPSAVNSQEGIQLVNGQTNIPAPLKAKLEEMKTSYEDQKNIIIGQVLNAQFKIMLPNGSPKIVGIDWNADDIEIPYEKIKAMKEDAQRKRHIEADEQNKINEFNLVTRTNFIQTIESFGKNQIYRFDTDDNSAAKEVSLSKLTNIFWARDLLRAWTGIPLGIFGINYKVKKFEWNFFSDNNYIPWVGQFFTKDHQLTDMKKKIIEALRVQESRDKKVLGEGVDLLDRIFSFANFIKGEAQLSEINVAVLKLILRDIEADELVMAGSRRQMVDLYRERYYINETATAEVKERAANYRDYVLGTSDGDFADVSVVREGTVRGAFSTAYSTLESLVGKIDEGNRNLAAIRELEMKQNKTLKRLRNDMDKL